MQKSQGSGDQESAQINLIRFQPVKTREIAMPIQLGQRGQSKEQSVSSRAMFPIYKSENQISGGHTDIVRTPHYHLDDNSQIDRFQSSQKTYSSVPRESKPNSTQKPRTSYGPKNIILSKRIHTSQQDLINQNLNNSKLGVPNNEQNSCNDNNDEIAVVIKDQDMDDERFLKMEMDIQEVTETDRELDTEKSKSKLRMTKSTGLGREEQEKVDERTMNRLSEINLNSPELPDIKLIVSKQRTGEQIEEISAKLSKEKDMVSNRKNSESLTAFEKKQFSLTQNNFANLRILNTNAEEFSNIYPRKNSKQLNQKFGWNTFYNEERSPDMPMDLSPRATQFKVRSQSKFSNKIVDNLSRSQLVGTKMKLDANPNIKKSQQKIKLLRKPFPQELLSKKAIKSSNQTNSFGIAGMSNQHVYKNDSLIRKAYQLELVNIGIKDDHSSRKSRKQKQEARSGQSSQNLDLVVSPAATGNNSFSPMGPRRIITLNSQFNTVQSSNKSKINSQSSEINSKQQSSILGFHPYKSRPIKLTSRSKHPLLIQDDGEYGQIKYQQVASDVSPKYQSTQNQMPSKNYATDRKDQHDASTSSLQSMAMPPSTDLKDFESNINAPSQTTFHIQKDVDSIDNSKNVNKSQNQTGYKSKFVTLNQTDSNKGKSLFKVQNNTQIVPELMLSFPGQNDFSNEAYRSISNMLPTFKEKASPFPSGRTGKDKSNVASKSLTPEDTITNFQPIKQKNLEVLIQDNISRGSKKKKGERTQVISKLENDKKIIKSDLFDKGSSKNISKDNDKSLTIPQSQLSKQKDKIKGTIESTGNSKADSLTLRFVGSRVQSSLGKGAIRDIFASNKLGLSYDAMEVPLLDTSGNSWNEAKIDGLVANKNVQMLANSINLFKDSNSFDDLKKHQQNSMTHAGAFHQSLRQNLPFKQCHLSPKFKNEKLTKNKTVQKFNPLDRDQKNKSQFKDGKQLNLKQPFQSKVFNSKSKVTNDALRNLYRNQNSLEQFNAKVNAKTAKNKNQFKDTKGIKSNIQSHQASFQLFPDLQINSLDTGSQGSLPPIHKSKEMVIKKVYVAGSHSSVGSSKGKKILDVRQNSQDGSQKDYFLDDIQEMTDLAMKLYKEQQGYFSSGGITPNQSYPALKNVSGQDTELPSVQQKKNVVNIFGPFDANIDPQAISTNTDPSPLSQDYTPKLNHQPARLNNAFPKPVPLNKTRVTGMQVHQLTASAGSMPIITNNKQIKASLNSFQDQIIDIQNQQVIASNLNQHGLQIKGFEQLNKSGSVIVRSSSNIQAQKESILGHIQNEKTTNNGRIVGSRIQISGMGFSNEQGEDSIKIEMDDGQGSYLVKSSQKPVHMPRAASFATIVVNAPSVIQTPEQEENDTKGEKATTGLQSPLIIQEMIPKDRSKKSLYLNDKSCISSIEAD